ncbi:MAG TPA: iron ABC transporter permease [Bdellovibrionales bacterium]|nr:iron ABC transporter permease [Bdellovibrionales bacterium]
MQSTSQKRKFDPVLAALLFFILGGLSLFVLWPLALVLKASVTSEGAFSAARYTEILANSQYAAPLWNSLKLGAVVAVAGTVVGYVFAYVLVMTSAPFKRVFRFIATFPIISPPFIVALAAIMLFGVNGVLRKEFLEPLFGTNLPSVYGFWGLFVVETITYFPTAFLVLVGVFAAIDPVLEEAAQNQGAGKFQTFRDVIFPLSIPGILSSVLLIFIESLADFGNPLILSGDYKVLAVEAYLKITGEYDTAGGAALAMLLLVPSLIAFFVQRYWLEKKSYVTLSGKPSSSRRPQSTWLTKAALFTLCAIPSAVVLLLYGSVIYGSFVQTWGADNTFTYTHYTGALNDAWDSLSDSLLLAAIATPITGIIGMIIAYLVVRRSFVGRTFMEVSAMLTFAVPGTVVGIGYILAFNDRPFLLTGTAVIIILLFIFRNAPVGIQSGMTAIRQLDRSIEEASANLGAGMLTTFRKIVLPLVAPAFFSGLAYSFVRSMTAVSAVIFVVSGTWNLATVSILGFVENSYLSKASAMCMILVAIVSVALGLMQTVVHRMGVNR